MTTPNQPSQRYLYGFVPPEADLGSVPTGLDDADIQRFDTDQVSAVVSPLAVDGEIRPRRGNLRAHQRVVRALFDEAPVLPAAFGTICHSPGELRRMIEKHGDMLADELEGVRGAAEWHLDVVIDRENAFEYFVEQFPGLRDERDRIYAEGREPSRAEKIELGERFETLLEEQRRASVEILRNHLEEPSRQIDVEDPRSEESLASVACLVDSTDESDFEEAVHEAADEFEDSLLFELVGPSIPYSFVEMELDFKAVA